MSSYIDDYQNLTEGATVEITKYRQQDSDIRCCHKRDPNGLQDWHLRQGQSILLDPIVRKAILMTMDKDRIVNETMQGLGTRADSVLAPGFWHKDIDEVPYDRSRT